MTHPIPKAYSRRNPGPFQGHHRRQPQEIVEPEQVILDAAYDEIDEYLHEDPAPLSMTMLKSEMLTLARAKGLHVTELNTKKEILQALEATLVKNT